MRLNINVSNTEFLDFDKQKSIVTIFIFGLVVAAFSLLVNVFQQPSSAFIWIKNITYLFVFAISLLVIKFFGKIYFSIHTCLCISTIFLISEIFLPGLTSEILLAQHIIFIILFITLWLPFKFILLYGQISIVSFILILCNWNKIDFAPTLTIDQLFISYLAIVLSMLICSQFTDSISKLITKIESSNLALYELNTDLGTIERKIKLMQISHSNLMSYSCSFLKPPVDKIIEELNKLTNRNPKAQYEKCNYDTILVAVEILNQQLEIIDNSLRTDISSSDLQTSYSLNDISRRIKGLYFHLSHGKELNISIAESLCDKHYRGDHVKLGQIISDVINHMMNLGKMEDFSISFNSLEDRNGNIMVMIVIIGSVKDLMTNFSEYDLKTSGYDEYDSTMLEGLGALLDVSNKMLRELGSEGMVIRNMPDSRTIIYFKIELQLVESTSII